MKSYSVHWINIFVVVVAFFILCSMSIGEIIDPTSLGSRLGYIILIWCCTAYVLYKIFMTAYKISFSEDGSINLHSILRKVSIKSGEIIKINSYIVLIEIVSEKGTYSVFNMMEGISSIKDIFIPLMKEKPVEKLTNFPMEEIKKDEGGQSKKRIAKIILAIFLTFIMIGLGHMAYGKIRRGIFMYILSNLALVAAFFIAIQPRPLFNIVAGALILISIFLFIVIDAIRVASKKQETANNTSKLKALIEYTLLVGIVLINSYIVQPMISETIKAKYVQAFKIPSLTMAPTLLEGDHLLVDKRQEARNPQRGDIVVFEYPVDKTKDFIKRVVAVGGDTVEVKDKRLIVNGTIVEEPYAIHKDKVTYSVKENSRDQFGQSVIPSDSYFVLGDNRDESLDSRFWGVVDRSKIKGRASTIYWSWDKENNRIRWDRIGKPIN